MGYHPWVYKELDTNEHSHRVREPHTSPLSPAWLLFPNQILSLENSMDRGAWRATVHRVKELDTTEATELACLFACLRCPSTGGSGLQGSPGPHCIKLEVRSTTISQSLHWI